MRQSSADFSEHGTFRLEWISFTRAHISHGVHCCPCSLRGHNGCLLSLLEFSTVSFSVRWQSGGFDGVEKVLNILLHCLHLGVDVVT